MDFSFEGLKLLINNRLSLLSDWASILKFSVTQRIIDATAFVLSKFSTYSEFLLNESKWQTARNRSSFIYQTPYLSYFPHRKKSSSGFIELSTDPSFANPWTGNTLSFPEWSTFTIDNKNIFLASTYTYATSDGNSKTLPVSQGNIVETFYTATGTLSETIEIDNDSVDNEHIKIYSVIDEINEVYEEIETTTNIYTITDPDLLVCEISNDYDYTKVILKFGDNINGRALNVGERLRIVYAETLGDLGNIYNTGTAIVNFTVLDSFSNPVTLYARVNDYIDGGKDIEDIDSIKLNAPALFQTGYRCGNTDDWNTILAQKSSIGKVFVYGEYELYKDILASKTEEQAILDGDLTASGRVPNVDNIAFIVALSPSGEILSDDDKDDIVQNYLRGMDGSEKKISPTTFISWDDPEIIDLRVISNVLLEVTAVSSEVVNDVTADLDAEYDVMNQSFFGHLYKSIFDSFIQNISGVFKHDTMVYVRDLKYEKDSQSGLIFLVLPTCIENSLHVNIKRKINGVWGDWELALYDDGLGGFKELKQYKIENGYIDYATGNVKFTFLGDGLTHITNGEFTEDLTGWSIDPSVSPNNVAITRVNSTTELGEASNDSSLENYASDDPYCLKIIGVSGNSGNVNDNWVSQELDLTTGETYELNMLVYAPSSNITGSGNAIRYGIGTALGLTDIANHVFNTPTDGNEDEWTHVTLTFTAGATNFLNLFMNSTTTSDKWYCDAVESKHTEPDISWGINDPDESGNELTAYAIEIYYQPRSDEDIILQHRDQIINMSSSQILVNTEYQS